MLFHGCSALFVEIHAEGEIDLEFSLFVKRRSFIGYVAEGNNCGHIIYFCVAADIL